MKKPTLIACLLLTLVALQSMKVALSPEAIPSTPVVAVVESPAPTPTPIPQPEPVIVAPEVEPTPEPEPIDLPTLDIVEVINRVSVVDDFVKSLIPVVPASNVVCSGGVCNIIEDRDEEKEINSVPEDGLSEANDTSPTQKRCVGKHPPEAEEQLVVEEEHSNGSDSVEEESEPEHEADKEEIIIGRQMHIVAYTAEWCSVCKEMKPVWAEIEKEGSRVQYADIDHPPVWAIGYKPKQIPITALFDGAEFQCQWLGKVEAQELRDSLRYGEGVLPVSLGQVLASARYKPLDEAAMVSAQLQASRNQQGHHNWERRWRQLTATSGYPTIVEICAESWPEQRDADDEALWTEAFNCWRQSPGHWKVASGRWDAYGRARAQGSNGVWYFAIIVGSMNRNPPAQQPTTPQPMSDPQPLAPAVGVEDGQQATSQKKSSCAGGNCNVQYRVRRFRSR